MKIETDLFSEISENKTKLFDLTREERFINQSILSIHTHYKPTETFMYTYFTTSHPPALKTNSSETSGPGLRTFRVRHVVFFDKLQCLCPPRSIKGYRRIISETWQKWLGVICDGLASHLVSILLSCFMETGVKCRPGKPAWRQTNLFKIFKRGVSS